MFLCKTIHHLKSVIPRQFGQSDWIKSDWGGGGGGAITSSIDRSYQYKSICVVWQLLNLAGARCGIEPIRLTKFGLCPQKHEFVNFFLAFLNNKIILYGHL